MKTNKTKAPYMTFVSKNAKYKIGPFTFKNKLDITLFIRNYLDSRKQGEIIVDEKILEFVKCILKIHPTKNELKYNNVMVKIYQEEEYHNPYNNFFLELEDGLWENFSTQLCIKNIKPNKIETFTETDNLYDINVLNFGKYKGYSIEEILKIDKNYITWLVDNYQAITEREKEYYRQLLEIKIKEDKMKNIKEEVKIEEVELVTNTKFINDDDDDDDDDDDEYDNGFELLYILKQKEIDKIKYTHSEKNNKHYFEILNSEYVYFKNENKSYLVENDIISKKEVSNEFWKGIYKILIQNKTPQTLLLMRDFYEEEFIMLGYNTFINNEGVIRCY